MDNEKRKALKEGYNNLNEYPDAKPMRMKFKEQDE